MSFNCNNGIIEAKKHLESLRFEPVTPIGAKFTKLKRDFQNQFSDRLRHTTPYVTKQKMLYFTCQFDTNIKYLQETSEIGMASP